MLEFISSADTRIPGKWFIADDNILLACMYHSSSQGAVKGFGASLGKGTVRIEYKSYNTKNMTFKTGYQRVTKDHQVAHIGLSINKMVGKEYIITTSKRMREDFYNFLMKNYSLPILKQWVPYIVDEAENNRYIQQFWPRRRTTGNIIIPMDDGTFLNFNDAVFYRTHYLSEEALKSIVSRGLSEKKICLYDAEGKPVEEIMAPLVADTFDAYMTNYGATTIRNLRAAMPVLSEIKPVVESQAFFKKVLYPQQSACVEGIKALKRAGEKYAFVVEEMGCGKTAQSISMCDSYFNDEWLRKNPDKTLKDLYLNDTVSYRVIMMAPSHLVEKWQKEIVDEVPNAKVTIIRDLNQLVEIRERGKERVYGREWYLISKDFAKLGGLNSPIPVNTSTDYMKSAYCLDCYEEKGFYTAMRYTGRKHKCPDCGGRRTGFRPRTEYGKHYAMTCPECGEQLIRYTPKIEGTDDRELIEKIDDIFLKPADFAEQRASNSFCYCCGAALWGVSAKPIDNGKGDQKSVHKSLWYKVSHFRNFARKATQTAFVLKHHEEEYKKAAICTDGWKELNREYGPRKFAPAQYVKRYLKGFFDFCVLDEAHKYENGGSAQSIAAGALSRASKFTLCLTGTLTNGKADSLFYLFYMLCPWKMKKMGYGYGDCVDFVKKYGAIQQIFKSELDERNNKSSRGKQKGQLRVIPGISPLLVTDFLISNSVFLDLSDMSKYLPKLKEEVCLVDMDEGQERAYRSIMDELKRLAQGKGGKSYLGQTLTFGLSWPDKPYGRKDIMNTEHDGVVDVRMINLPEYEETVNLLPKEEKLVEIINKEISEERNCFVYASYTGEAEQNVTYRLKDIIERECNLKDQVFVLESSSPCAEKRDAFIKELSSKGYRVIICNPKCVETGLDFCWYDEKGEWHNYPSLIFYQMNYELAVMWQASRRAYRLIQTEECRNYYLGYTNSLQSAALEIMAEKQVAAGAIQGKFSVEGLSALAKGVDPRMKLAKMLAEGDMSSEETLVNMFDALARTNEGGDDEEERYGKFTKGKTYFELMGTNQGFTSVKEMSEVSVATETSNEAEQLSLETFKITQTVEKTNEEKKVVEVSNDVSAVNIPAAAGVNLFNLWSDMFDGQVVAEVLKTEADENLNKVDSCGNELLKAKEIDEKVGKSKKIMDGQVSLFDMLAC